MRLWRPRPRPRADPRDGVVSTARTHVGRVRRVNEDRVFDCAERGLWAVADGMGGHDGGDLAAQAVVEAFRASCVEGDGRDGSAVLLHAVHAANRAILERNRELATDAGSTVVAARIDGRTATIAWVGDSRAYLIRRGRVTQLTHDHSLVQDLIDAGLLTVGAAMHHPQANVVTRALGIAPTVEVAVHRVDLLAGDRLLLCSDGLSRSLDPTELGRAQPLAAFADTLVADALRRDGTDNISLVAVDLPAPPRRPVGWPARAVRHAVGAGLSRAS